VPNRQKGGFLIRAISGIFVSLFRIGHRTDTDSSVVTRSAENDDFILALLTQPDPRAAAVPRTSPDPCRPVTDAASTSLNVETEVNIRMDGRHSDSTGRLQPEDGRNGPGAW